MNLRSKVFWIARLVAAMLLAWLGTALRAGAESPPASKSDTVRLVFVGDMMLDETPGEMVVRGEDPFAPTAKLLDDCDLAIGNLECVMATGGEKYEKKFNFRAHPRCVPVLKKHFQAVTVANNHSGDYGHDALVEEFDLLEKANLPYFGGGPDFEHAHVPLVIEKHGLRIALLGYCEFQPRAFAAGEHTPGVAWSADDKQVLADIKAARERYHADVVIPFMHWGWEDEGVNERQQKFGRQMIDAGATLVVGAHPHVTQGADCYKGCPIVYSLGNFLFNGFDTDETQTGWMLRATVSKSGVVAWDTVVVRLDEQGVPHPDGKAKSPCGAAGGKEVDMRVAQ